MEIFQIKFKTIRGRGTSRQLWHTSFTFSVAQLIRLLRNFITDKLASLCSRVLATTAQWIAGTATSHLRNARGHFCRHLHENKQNT